MKYTLDNIGELEAELAKRGVLEPARVIEEEIRWRLEEGYWICDGDHGDKVVMIYDSSPQKCGECYKPTRQHGLHIESWTGPSSYTTTKEEHRAWVESLAKIGAIVFFNDAVIE